MKLLQNASTINQRRNVTVHLQHHPLDVSTDSRIAVTSMMLVSSIAIVVYVVLNSMREALQIYQQKWKYLFEPNNLVSWMLYISATLMVSPVFNDGTIDDVHFSATSLTVFLSWFNLLLFLQRFDQVSVASMRIVWIISLNFVCIRLSDWHLCGHVPGNFADPHQSAVGILDFDHCIRFGILHRSIEFGEDKCKSFSSYGIDTQS